MKRLIVSLLGAVVFAAAAQAQEPPAPPVATVDASAQAPVAEEAKSPPLSDRHCLRHTGTRIVARAERRARYKCAPAFGRAYTREELDRTGQVNIADALRMLDPSIH